MAGLLAVLLHQGSNVRLLTELLRLGNNAGTMANMSVSWSAFYQS